LEGEAFPSVDGGADHLFDDVGELSHLAGEGVGEVLEAQGDVSVAFYVPEVWELLSGELGLYLGEFSQFHSYPSTGVYISGVLHEDIFAGRASLSGTSSAQVASGGWLAGVLSVRGAVEWPEYSRVA